MANSLPTDAVQRITQRTQVRFNRIAQACRMGFIKVVSNTTGWAGIFTSFKQANCWPAYIPAIGALKFNSVGMCIHRLTSRGLG